MRETKFKQTEAGLCPVDWDCVTFQEYCCFSTNTVETSSFPIENYVGTENLLQDKLGVVDFTGTLPYNRVKQYSKGDILISNIRPYLKKCWHADKDGGCSSDVLVIKGDKSKYDDTYLFYALCNDKFFADVNAQAKGTKMPRGDKKVINEYYIQCPPLDEQRRIAKALSDVDGLISSLTKLIEKKQNIKTATMQQLLTGKKRLEGFTEPWKESSIDEIFSIVGNNCVSRNEMSTSGCVRNIHYGDVLIKFGAVINADVEELPYIIGRDKARHPLCDGDIIMADTAEDETCGKVCEVRGVGDSMIESGLHTIALRPRKVFGKNFLGYYMNSAAFHDLLLPLMQGTKVTSISKSALMEVCIKVPSSVDEQTAIANILTDMDNEISALETKKAKYESIKKGMMQELLTGKIRLV